MRTLILLTAGALGSAATLERLGAADLNKVPGVPLVKSWLGNGKTAAPAPIADSDWGHDRLQALTHEADAIERQLYQAIKAIEGLAGQRETAASEVKAWEAKAKEQADKITKALVMVKAGPPPPGPKPQLASIVKPAAPWVPAGWIREQGCKKTVWREIEMCSESAQLRYKDDGRLLAEATQVVWHAGRYHEWEAIKSRQQ